LNIAKILVAINCFVYVLPFLISRNINDLLQTPSYFVKIVGFAPNVIETKEWWRFITPIFVHGNLLHLFMNMYGMIVLGTVLKYFYKSQTSYFLIFVTGGIGGLIANQLLYGGAVSVGASGGLMALVGSLVYPAIHKNNHKYAYQIIFVILLQLLVFDSLFPNIDRAAHLGGTLTGLNFGYFYSILTVKKITLEK
jgi:rhomboid protease GluP